MSEGTMAQFEIVLNGGNLEETFEALGANIKSAATQSTEWFGELVDPDMERRDSATTDFAPSHVDINAELTQAQNKMLMLQQKMNFMATFNANFPKFLRNLGKKARNEERVQRRQAAEMKKALAASIASESKRIADDK
jgi:hypothetical protein